MSNDTKKSLLQRYNKFQKAPKFGLDSKQLYCVCRMPDNGELMVACDGCDEWFHFKCMHLNKKYKNLISKFYCVFCDELFGRGKTQFKRKCRLPECYKPARVDLATGRTSKYCCDAHGVKFMKEFVLDAIEQPKKKASDLSVPLAKKAVSITTYSEFKSLGMTLPNFDKIKGKSLVDLMSGRTRERLANIDVNIGNLEKSEKTYESKLKYLMKLRGMVKKLNEILTNAIADNDEILTSTDFTLQSGKGAKQSRNGKKGRKSKRRPKTDICGYDNNLQLLGSNWLKFSNNERYKYIINWDNNSPPDDAKVLNEFKLLRKQLEITEELEKEGEDEEERQSDEEKGTEMSTTFTSPNDYMVDKKETIFCGLCIKDKKRCNKHLTWYTTIYDTLDSKIASISEKINTLKRKKDEIKQEENIRLWESWRNNSSSENRIVSNQKENESQQPTIRGNNSHIIATK